MTAWHRAGVTMVMLIPFTIGSQRCMIGALGIGGPMACMPAASAHGQPSTGACCDGPGERDGEASPASDAPMRSCCIESAPVPAPTSLEAASIADLAFAVVATFAVSRPEAPVSATARAPAESPPDPLAGPPPHSRAPPRA